MNEIFKLSDDWGTLLQDRNIIPFGVGRIGRRVIPTLLTQFNIPFLVDNGSNVHELFGLKVVKLKDAVNYMKENNIKIVVTTVLHSYEIIKRDMEQYGFVENVDFCLFERFAEEWNLRWNNKCVLSKIDTVITSRCTLKCQNCNMFISHMTSQADIEFDKLKENFDVFFDSIDFVYEYTLLGGEPLLHKNIKEIIMYLMDNYGERIGRINIISNGTVLPDRDLVDLLVKYSIIVHISDYTGAVNYVSKIRKIEQLFISEGIEYYIIPNNVWKDVIFPKNEFKTDNPREHMILCGHSTHSVANGKLYWCDPAFAAECFMGFDLKEDDVLDLRQNKQNNSKYDATKNIMNYLLGNVNERGYMSICEKCAGVGSDNDNYVPAGVQLER